MTGTIASLLIAGLVASSSAPQRVALLVGNNHGALGRPALAYAEDDAREMQVVLQELAGVGQSELLLADGPAALELAFDRVAAVVQRSSGPTTLIFYYSGHADGSALHMNGGRYSYERLRQRLGGSGAQLFVAIVDACGSGQLVRAKGGQAVPVIDLDVSYLDRTLKGGVVLTSSGPGELAQESEELQGSFFTHYLISGLRGAADTSGDGRVSLDEAYQFVYHQTLARTQSSLLGPQHPSYGVNLDGRGELVLAWRDQGGSTLLLPAAARGRYFVRSKRSSRIVAELEKLPEQELRISLTPGSYEITRLEPPTLWATSIELTRGAEHLLDPASMVGTPLSSRLAKGSEPSWEVGAAFRAGTGYLIDSTPLYGGEVSLAWRLRPFEFGGRIGVRTSSYRRRDAIEVELVEGSLRAFGVFVAEPFGGLDLHGGFEVGWGWVRQRGQQASQVQAVEGPIAPLALIVGARKRWGPVALSVRGDGGVVVRESSEALGARWTAGLSLGAAYVW